MCTQHPKFHTLRQAIEDCPGLFEVVISAFGQLLGPALHLGSAGQRIDYHFQFLFCESFLEYRLELFFGIKLGHWSLDWRGRQCGPELVGALLHLCNHLGIKPLLFRERNKSVGMLDG